MILKSEAREILTKVLTEHLEDSHDDGEASDIVSDQLDKLEVHGHIDDDESEETDEAE